LHDSLLFYQKGKYASAIVMALFAREEVGRYKLLRDLRKDMVEKGRTVTVEDIRRKCEDHATKQLQGQFGVMLKSSGDDQMGKLIRAKFDYHPQSPEAHRAAAQLDSIVKQQSREMPHKRHDLRQNPSMCSQATQGAVGTGQRI